MKKTYEEYDKALIGEEHDCDVIAKHEWVSLLYAQNVIKGQWVQGEKAIATNKYYSQSYARHINQDFLLKPQR